MLTHPTLDTLRALKLDGMAEAFTELQTQDGSADLIPPSGMPDSRWGFPSGPISDSMW